LTSPPRVTVVAAFRLVCGCHPLLEPPAGDEFADSTGVRIAAERRRQPDLIRIFVIVVAGGMPDFEPAVAETFWGRWLKLTLLGHSASHSERLFLPHKRPSRSVRD